MRLGVAALIAAGALVLGCGGDGEDQSREIEVAGRSAKDKKIARDLREYIERECRRTSGLEEFRAAIARAEEPPPRVLRRAIRRRYGSIAGAFRTQRAVCAGYRTIEVHGGVITVLVALRDDQLGRMGASDVCNVIQGADVADFTAGHRVLGEDGFELTACPARPD
jgi:hypothetical protein